jgi:nicotinate-nucleotide pyrophosphorylase (carboxylating)
MLDIHSDTFQKQLKVFIAQALFEDVGAGDLTAMACLSSRTIAYAKCILRESGIIAGLTLAEMIFKQFDKSIEFISNYVDGDYVKAGEILFEVKGRQRSILSSERVVLNSIQRMSGIATLTRKVQKSISHTHCKVLDTRKTTPGFRIIEKWAVQIGGGVNHRMGLYDMIMLKDNHIDYCGSISVALKKTLEYLRNSQQDIPIVVEVRNLKEVRDCIPYADNLKRLLLDNMDTQEIREALQIIDSRIQTEASGGINFENAPDYAETGVNFISMGSIIYDAKVLDMSLKAFEH